MNDVWIYAEDGNGELLSAGRRLGGRVVAFGVAETALRLAAELGRHGAAAVYAVEGVDGRLPAGPVAGAIAPYLAGAGFVLLPASYDGRDLAGRLSARLDRTVVGNAVALTSDGTVDTTVFGGAIRVRTAFRGPRPWIVTVRPKSFTVQAVTEGIAPEIFTLTAPAIAAPGVVSRHAEPREGPTLDEADVVVAGGRGLGSPEAFEQVAELARLLGGAPGASRAAVDAGWVPYAWQIGQTGRIVAPSLYLALGISGAAQHLVGMKGARHVVAVNADRGAPIFDVADLGIVGDAATVTPRLIEALRARRRDR